MKIKTELTRKYILIVYLAAGDKCGTDSDCASNLCDGISKICTLTGESPSHHSSLFVKATTMNSSFSAGTTCDTPKLARYCERGSVCQDDTCKLKGTGIQITEPLSLLSML